MKTILFTIVLGMALGIPLTLRIENLQNQVNELRTDVLNLAEAQNHYNDLERSNRLSDQDKLEERLGTVEHDLDQVVFLIGKHK